ncbi:ABC transporter substrate-binding protein [Cellulosilyticum ruminicola]|uniref:ABC transporter substrate-binding protein n=1 Tax=Cellulosilyticum ruminicola TaxID=425254 RepID=UPI0006D2BFAE|nr:ABC transporter substrate-binding protein [Cellulosilyticum ruminicola]
MKMKRVFSAVLGSTMLMSMLAGCGGSTETSVAANGGEIYFLNFKPESAEIYDKITADYEAETGVKVKVVTAASGTYETTLKSEIAKSEPPTIFQINGPVGYQNWKDYCADLKDTKLYSYLTDQSLAVSSEGNIYGIPYVVEGYGIIYNDAIMQQYFSLTNKAVDISSMDQINNFDTLSKVVTDMTAHKDELGIEGVFASTSLGAGEQWRWQTHLANIPFYYEFSENVNFDNSILAGLDAKTVDFKYSQNYKNIFDLYMNNSCTEPAMLSSKSVDDSMAEFALGKVAMVQNGNWAWGQISGVDGNTVTEDNIKYLPIYTGIQGEESQGLCIGTENYFAINSKVSKEQQDASIAFLEWLFSSEKGKAYVTNDLKFIAPFNTFTEAEKPADPLAKEVLNWMSKDGVKLVPWTFSCFPSEDFKNTFGDGLVSYAQGQEDWQAVEKTVKDAWASEVAAKAE